MRRFLPAIVLNALVPGTGLILLGRQWIGLGLTLCFATSAELAAAGALLAPAAVPKTAVLLATLMVLITWVAAQGLLIARIRFLRGPHLAAQLAALRAAAEKSLLQGQAETARCAVRTALSMDASDVATHVLWARLLTTMGQPQKARRAWRQAARLDRGRRFEAEIRKGIEQLEMISSLPGLSEGGFRPH